MRAVVTLAAPVTPKHIERHIAADLAAIEAEGEAQVVLAGRMFTFRQQLIDDLEGTRIDEAIVNLGRPLLVIHSPTPATSPKSSSPGRIETPEATWLSIPNPITSATLRKA